MFERSIAHPITFSGLGIHTGKTVTLTLQPSTTSGIRFIRTDCNNACVPVTPETLQSQQRATALSHKGITILTPEHLLAALHAFKITNLDIEIDAEEVPILDGSSLLFYTQIAKTGVTETEIPLAPLIIHDPIYVEENEAIIIGLPSAQTTFSYRLSYTNFIGHQFHTYTPNTDSFENDIAPARTYGFYHEVKALQEKGLALGGSFDNAIVIGENEYMSKLRFENELCRHKLLDLFGDLWVLGRPIQGHIIGIKSGHSLTKSFVQTLTHSLQR